VTSYAVRDIFGKPKYIFVDTPGYLDTRGIEIDGIIKNYFHQFPGLELHQILLFNKSTEIRLTKQD